MSAASSSAGCSGRGDHAAATAQESARRIGICLVDYEMFWWRCDDGEPCPVCPLDDEEYAANHRFYVAESSEQPVSGVSSAS